MKAFFIGRRSTLSLYILLLILVLFLYIFIGENYSPLLLSLTIIACLIAVIIFLIRQENFPRIKGHFLRPSTLFITGYLIVFFQCYIDLLVGNLTEYDRLIFVDSRLINKAALLSLGGLITFFVGYILYTPRKNLAIARADSSQIIYPLNILKIFFVLVTFLFIYFNGSDCLIGSYSQEYLENKAGTMALYSEILFIITFMSIITLHCRNSSIKGISTLWQYVKSLGLLFHICLLIYIGLVMISGSRGPIMILGVSYICSFILIAKKRVHFSHFIAFVVVGAFILTALGYARNMDKTIPFVDRLSIAVQEREVRRESFATLTSELATSIRTLHYAMNYVPEAHPYLYGSIQFRQVLGTIPFASSATKSFFNDNFRYQSSAYFITWIAQGNSYTYGTGSSVVADLYLSFGLLGVLFGLFLFGMLIRKIELYVFYIPLNKIPLFYLILAIFAYGYTILISRASILSPLNFFIFTVIFTYIYQVIIRMNLNIPRSRMRHACVIQ